MTCPHSRDFLLAGRFDFIAGYLARGSISEGERRGSVLLAALLVLTRRLLSAGRGTRGMGEWKRADLNRGPRGSSVALGGARSPLGELGHSWGSSGGAQSPSAERPPGEHGHPGGARSLCFVWVPGPGGAAQRLSLLYIITFSFFLTHLIGLLPAYRPRITPGRCPPRLKNKSPDAKSLDGNFTGNFTEEDRLQRLEHGLDEIESLGHCDDHCLWGERDLL